MGLLSEVATTTVGFELLFLLCVCLRFSLIAPKQMSLFSQEWEETQKGPKYFPPGMNEHNGPHELKNKNPQKIIIFFYHQSLQEQREREGLA